MPVAAEVYSAGACVRGHLQRVIQACSRGTWYVGLDLYDIGSSIGFNSGLHRVVDDIRPVLPVALVAGPLHTHEKHPDEYPSNGMPVSKFLACNCQTMCWHSGACPLVSSRRPAMRSSCVSTTDAVSTQTSVMHTERRHNECTFRLELQIAICQLFKQKHNRGFD